MMWKDICYLGKAVNEKNAAGGKIKKVLFKKAHIYCNLKGVVRQEFYNAALAGIKPTLTVEIMRDNYGDQEYMQHNDVIYSIVRNYDSQRGDTIELTLEKKINPPEVTYEN